MVRIGRFPLFVNNFISKPVFEILTEISGSVTVWFVYFFVKDSNHNLVAFICWVSSFFFLSVSLFGSIYSLK